MSCRESLARIVVGGVLTILGLSPTLNAKAPQAAPRPFETLRAVPPGSAPRAIQVRLRWTTDEPMANPAKTRNRFEILSVERLAVRAVAPRTAGVGPDTLIVVGEDAAGQELSWRVVADPRVVRSESSVMASLSGERLVYLQTELLFALPDVSGTARIRVYKPRSQDGLVVLDALGAAAIQ